MIHLKRISVLIALAAALCLIVGPATATAKTLTAGTNSGAIDAEVSIPITLDDPSGVGGIAFTLTYDPAVLQFVSLLQGGKVIADGSGTYTTDQLKSNLFYQVNDEGAPSARTGRVMVAAATAQALTGTNLALFNAKFKILAGNGTYPIGVVKTIVQNASAGYTSPTQLPVLVGTTTPNQQGMYTSTDFPIYAATLVAGGITVNAPKFTIGGSVIYQGGASATGSTVVLKRNSGSGWVLDAQTTVGSTGTYSFANKAAGTYHVFVTSNDPNYANGESADVTVAAANVTVPQITLAAPQRLTGTVTLNGSGLAGLQVKVMNGATVVGVYAVNPDGTFQTPPLPTGPTYTLYAIYGSYSQLITAGEVNTLNTTLRSIGGNISGLTGVQTLTITASSVNGQLQKTTTATTNAGAGTYSIANLIPAADYIVSLTGSGVPVTYYNNKTDITQATAVDITAANKTDAHFNFAGITMGTIAGTVTETSAPVAGIGVYAFETSTFALTQVMTNGSGVYSLTLAPGTYEVFVIKANNKNFYYKDGGTTQSQADSTKLVVTAGGSLTGKNIDITECTGVLTGKVTFTRPDGDPAANVLITATSSNGNGITMTGANGVYTIGGLCGADYRVEMNPLDSRYAVQSATVTIGTGATVTQNFVIGAGNVLSGTITESPGGTTPIPNAMIYLLDQQSGTLVNGRMYFSGAGGSYTIADIPNSVDTLNVTHPSYRPYREVDLSITADLTKNVQLVKGSYFNVTVLDGSNGNAPLAGVLVIVARTGDIPVYALTDGAGNCKIYGLDAANSDYIILAQKPGYERQSLLSQTPSLAGQPISFTLTRPAVFNLGGTIKSGCAGTPAVPGAYVLVSTGDFFASAISNGSGVYSFTDLPQGSGYRFVVVPGGALRTYVETGLTFAATTTKDVTIPCGQTITGTITDGTNGVAATVLLYTALNEFVGYTVASTAGAYSFPGLANSTTYKVLAVATGFSPKWYNGKATIDAADPVSAGGVANITLTLAP